MAASSLHPARCLDVSQWHGTSAQFHLSATLDAWRSLFTLAYGCRGVVVPKTEIRVTIQAQLISLGVKGNLTAWFCAATLITRLRFVFSRFAGLLRFTRPKTRSANERSAQVHGHSLAIAEKDPNHPFFSNQPLPAASSAHPVS
jgi:hypothetical protein